MSAGATLDRERPRLLVVSHVLPYPGSAGQQQRVRFTLQGLRPSFHITFVTIAPTPSVVEAELARYCDVPVVLPSRYARRLVAKIPQRAAGFVHSARTGLRWSNYVIGELEFTPERLRPLVDSGRFDCVLFEYWHAWQSVDLFRTRGIPCVLDMHDVLWRSRQEQLDSVRALPAWWKRRALDQYRECEERAWSAFDGIVTISRGEDEYVKERASAVRRFYAPMGVDLNLWRYQWQPSDPPRVAFYGGMGTERNERAALSCLESVMPAVWQTHPTAEFWIVGSNPSGRVKALAADPRIHVTGFVEQVQPILASMTLVLCPWTGTFGFRSRLVEVMALGVPVVATADAVHGMGLEDDRGLFIGRDVADLREPALRLLADEDFARSHSRLARQQVERHLSLDATYGALAGDLRQWLLARKPAAPEPAAATA